MFAGYGRYRRALRHRLLGGRAMRRRGILEGLGVLRAPLVGWRDGYEASEKDAPEGLNKLQTLQAIDCADWLPNDLLIKLDRCLMAHGVEGRTPFLDPVVADVAMKLPDDLKIKNGQGKYLLRTWLAGKLPEADPFSSKRGFTVPVADWIERKGKQIGDLVARQECIAEICHRD